MFKYFESDDVSKSCVGHIAWCGLAGSSAKLTVTRMFPRPPSVAILRDDQSNKAEVF